MKGNNKITLLSTPVIVDIGEWVISNIGKVAAAKRSDDHKKATIYAIEDADVASPQMMKYVKENDAVILVGISKGEVDAID